MLLKALYIAGQVLHDGGVDSDVGEIGNDFSRSRNAVELALKSRVVQEVCEVIDVEDVLVFSSSNSSVLGLLK